MKALILSSPDLLDSALAEVFDQMPVRVVLPSSGHYPERHRQSHRYRLFELHQAILKDRRKTWFQPLAVNDQDPGLGAYETQLAGIIESMGDNWLIQDSLLCQLLPPWRSQVDELVAFLYFSEPLECAVSLQEKWRFPIVFGLALWEHYLLSALDKLAGLPCIPVSYSQLRSSPVGTVQTIRDRISQLNGDDARLITVNTARWRSLRFRPRADLSRFSGFPGDAHDEIYARLEAGEVQALQGRSLSPQSADILDYYGQLRAGYEHLRTQQAAPRAHGEADSSHHPENETHMTKSANQEPIMEGNEELLEVTVHIKGLRAVEFLAEADSPILSMLTRAMQQGKGDTPDELVYLNYADDEAGALYFRRSSLLGFETNPVSQ